MKEALLAHVDAFTDKPFCGNAAAVILPPASISKSEMQKIAREMNLSETVFILPPSSAIASFRIRWFTPANEVPLCGHATIAAVHRLAEIGYFGSDVREGVTANVETKSGILPVSVIEKRNNISVKFTLPMPRFSSARAIPEKILPTVGLTARDQAKKYPAVIAGNIYIPVKNLSLLKILSLDFRSMKKILMEENLMGLCLFTEETFSRQSSFHSRFFAPNDGIDEDPVTGSANGPLGVYFTQFVDNKNRSPIKMYYGEQGHFLDRPGKVGVEVVLSGNNDPQSVSIIGSAITLYTGIISY